MEERKDRMEGGKASRQAGRQAGACSTRSEARNTQQEKLPHLGTLGSTALC